MDEERRRKVFERVRLCLENLVAGSGHLAAYTLDRETFRIEEARDLGGGLTEYAFAVDGWLQTEFDVGAVPLDPFEPAPEGEFPPASPAPEALRGALVLDAHGEFALDEAGRVRLRPWRTLDPDFMG